MVADVLVRQILSPEIAGIEELEQELGDLDDLDARGQEATVDVMAARIAPVARQHRVDERGQVVAVDAGRLGADVAVADFLPLLAFAASFCFALPFAAGRGLCAMMPPGAPTS